MSRAKKQGKMIIMHPLPRVNEIKLVVLERVVMGGFKVWVVLFLEEGC